MRIPKRWISLCLVILLLAGVVFGHGSLMADQAEAAEPETTETASVITEEGAGVPAVQSEINQPQTTPESQPQTTPESQPQTTPESQPQTGTSVTVPQTETPATEPQTEESTPETTPDTSVPAESESESVPAQTNAPESEDTQTPETTAPESTETETSESVETETETQESETQTQEPVSEAAVLKQEFTDASGAVIRTVTADIPEGAFEARADQLSMEVKFLDADSEAYIVSMMEDLLPENYELGGYVLYQIDFKVDGVSVQPAKAITISMEGNDLTVKDTEDAHVFRYDPADPQVAGDKDQLEEIIQKAQLIRSLTESGTGTANIEDYTYSEIIVNNKNADSITMKGWESGIYGCYTQNAPVALEGSAEGYHVALTGPASSFPEDGALTLSVKEVSQKTDKIAEEAVEEEAEKEDLQVVNYTALDITILKDGKEIQPLGPVNVTFTKEEKEEKEASADTKPDQIKVFHVDEETGKAQDMEATEADEGQVAIETDHFSVYVVVDLDQLGGQIDLTVQHWAQVNKLAAGDGSGTSGLEITGGYQDKVPSNSTATVKSESVFTEIYSPDTLTLDNTRKITVKELSKLYQANVNKSIKNYNLTAVWVLKGSQDEVIDNVNDTEVINKNWNVYSIPTDEEEQNTEDVEIKLEADSVIRMIYTPVSQEDALQQSVKFWDYNVTEDANTSDFYFNTDNKGINSAENYSNGDTSKRIAVGQASNGIFHDYAEASFSSGERVNMTMHSEQATTGMVNSVTQDGPVYTAGLTDPGLFTDKAVSGKKNVSGYSLSFNQEGNTYTLSSVKDENGNNTVDDLEKFKDIYDAKPSWSPNHKVIYSNNFWPLDKLQYAGKDINLGQKGVEYRITGNRYSTAGANAYQYEGWAKDRKTYLESDDGLAHNWFFGMRYDFDFTLGDYTGPLNYYFRGDDDFWLFIDGILAIDLGGIHSAVGKTLDLREFMNKNNMTDPDKTHRLTIIYAERGGSGSTCYMQFTIPNVTPVDVETTVEKTNVTIQKKWEDHGNPNRPSSVQVKLYYKGPSDTEWQYDESNGIKTLTEGNQWTATWTGLPKEGYSYKVEEVNVPDGYKVIYPDNSDAVYLPNNGSYEGEFTNKANPSTYITVIKKWDDGGLANQARPESVDFYLYYREKGSTTWLPYPADGRLTLTETDLQTDGTWKGVYDNLPVYGADNETLLEYTVKEVDGDSELIEGAYLPGKDDYQYTVHYPDDHYKDKNWKAYEAKADGETLNLTVTNSLGVSIKVNKEWKGHDPENDTVIYAGLYQADKAVADKWVELKADNNWRATFQYLPPANDYSVKELRKAESGETAEFTISSVGYVGVNSGDETSVENGDTAIKYEVSYSQLTQDTTDPSLSTVTITNQAQWQLIKYSSSTSTTDKPLPLKDAEFDLKHNKDGTTYKGVSDANGIVKWTKNDAEFTGVFPDGEYTLTETVAPTGYMLGDPVTFEMKDGVPVNMNNKNAVIKDGILTFYYANETLYVIPSSGGSGIYKYLFGGVLLMMAASLIVYKNKRREVLERK